MIHGFIFALQFLTRLPIPLEIKVNKGIISKSTFFFPYVGIIIAFLVYLIYCLFLNLDKQIAVFLTVFSIVVITGGLHVDGLADTCDGFFSHRSKEKVLEIMKDSRIGTFGVLAIIFDVFLKYYLILKIPKEMVLTALMVSLGIGRLQTSLLFTFGRPAKKEGLGNLFTQKESRIYWLFSFFSFSIFCFIILGVHYFIVLTATTLTGFFVMMISYKKIGGLTGDIYGACCELCEIVSYLVLVMGL